MKKILIALGVLVLALAMAGCAAGSPRFDASAPAGFWAGVWHGLICCVTFVIGLFNDHVRIYELDNAGHLYDLGFVLGAALAFGGGCGGSKACRDRKSPKEREWDEIGARVEEKVRRGIRDWLNETDAKPEDEWEEIGRKIEEKIKRELRTWADE